VIIKLEKPLSKRQISDINTLNEEIFKDKFAWFVITKLNIISVNCSEEEYKKIKKIIAH
jgi:hypothetical protein